MSPLVLVAVACAVMVATHFWLQWRWNKRLEEHAGRLEGQRDAQHKQAKQFQRELTSTQRRIAGVSDECARLLEDTKQMHAVAQDMVREVRHGG